MTKAVTTAEFWAALEEATDPIAYKPTRSENVIAARLEAWDEPYYILKEPLAQSYLRLSEPDYALWWQMNGRQSVKELLFYNLKRYQTLPIGHFNSLLADLRTGHFLQDRPVNIYKQVERELAARSPASQGRRLLTGFLNTEIGITGLDRFFSSLYRWLNWLFHPVIQAVFFLVILLGGGSFGRLFWQQTFALSSGGGWSILTLIAANLIVITIHELSHGLTTKHFGRELNRGGFLIYWGMPAFFVDTRDIWLSPRRQRIAVSWAGPHSGLIVGGLAGLGLTAVLSFFPQFVPAFWAGFLYQIGFVAYLTVFFNLNPLLELDGYFILMDWLDMPGLRRRAFQFWRQKLWPHFREHKAPREFWGTMNRPEQVFTFYGGLALVYSIYAILFALYFWQTRLLPLTATLWQDYGLLGQLAVLFLTAVIILPAVYYLSSFGWSRIQAGLEWLARRDLLARPDVLTLLTGLPLVAGITAVFLLLAPLDRADLWLNLGLWLLHVAAVAALAGTARQLPGSRYQWAMWAFTAVPAGITLAWISFITDIGPIWRDIALLAAAGGVLAAGIVAWYTIWPGNLQSSDRQAIAGFFLVGISNYVVMIWLNNGISWTPALIVLFVFAGLMLMTPLWLNFWQSRFALPWFLLILAAVSLPWLYVIPSLQPLVITLWLYAGLIYLLLGVLAQFGRQSHQPQAESAFQERERLIDSFNHFLEALFGSYEAIFGGRWLATSRTQILNRDLFQPGDGILAVGQKARIALDLIVDRLDDLAGTPFTRRAGQAAYDSLPWLEAETLARHVLTASEWGGGLAQGFIRARDRRTELIRQADIFAGFDQDAIRETAVVANAVAERKGALLARAGREAGRFFLIDSGEVGVFHDEVQVGTLLPGGYFGTNALLAAGTYQFTYRALGRVSLLVINREDFDPLLRADTTLATQVSSGAATRKMLRQMPLFSSLSPQELAQVDARLVRRHVRAGETIVKKGQSRTHLFIVADGRVEVTEDGTGGIIGDLGPGEHFGEYALFADVPYAATYRAAVNTTLLMLDEARFDEMVAGSDQMSRYVAQIGSGRLIATRRRHGLGAVVS